MTCFGSDATIGVLCPRLLDKASTALVPKDGDPPASGAPKPHKGCGFDVALFSLAVSTYQRRIERGQKMMQGSEKLGAGHGRILT